MSKNLRLELTGFDRETEFVARSIDITGRANLAIMAEILSRRPARLLYRDLAEFPLNRRMRSLMQNRIRGISLNPNLDWVFAVEVADPREIPFLRTPTPG